MSRSAQVPSGWIEVTPADVDLTFAGYGITCNGAAGNVRFTDGRGAQHTWPIAVGQVIPTEVTRIWSVASGATATLIAVGIS